MLSEEMQVREARYDAIALGTIVFFGVLSVFLVFFIPADVRTFSCKEYAGYVEYAWPPNYFNMELLNSTKITSSDGCIFLLSRSITSIFLFICTIIVGIVSCIFVDRSYSGGILGFVFCIMAFMLIGSSMTFGDKSIYSFSYSGPILINILKSAILILVFYVVSYYGIVNIYSMLFRRRSR